MWKSLVLLTFVTLFAACTAKPAPTSASESDGQTRASVTIVPTATLVTQGASTAPSLPTAEPRVNSTSTVAPNTAGSPPLASAFTLSVSEATRTIPRYRRNQWKHWIDQDSDCHNTRAEVLLDEALGRVILDGCRVVSGQWIGLYTGIAASDASVLDVDHMVPLANAHRSGGWAWDASRKQAFANDLRDKDHLIAVTASANRSKGARGPEDWRPPDSSYWCKYATDWARIKDTWNLSVTPAELAAIKDMLRGCPSEVAIVVADNPELLPEFLPTAAPVIPSDALHYDPFGADRDCGDFGRWIHAQAFYEAAGGPQKDPHRLDGDKDGVACTSLAGAP